jgi:hypothetical protein
MVFIPSQNIIHSVMNAILRNILITALFNHLFLNLKNRDGFNRFLSTSI